jgi:hypothetical protein
LAISLTSCSVDKSPGKQEDGDISDLGNDLGDLKVRNSLSPDVVGQADLGERWEFGLDGLK